MPFDYAALQARFNSCWRVNNGYGKEDATSAIASGEADLVAFGRPFISNPDLLRRLREDAALNPLQEDKLYGGGAAGYTDYPPLDATA